MAAAASSQSKDIEKLRLDVELIKQEQHNQTNAIADLKTDVAKNQQDIISKMDKFAYVTIKDYARDMADREKRDNAVQTTVDKRFEELESAIESHDKAINAGGLKFVNALNGGVFKAIVSIFVIGFFVVIVILAARVLPAVGSVT